MLLNSIQREQVINALRVAFPRYSDLKFMLSTQLNENIEMIVPLGSSLRDCIFELVVQMEAQGRLKELLHGALRQNPKNPQLLQCGMALGFIKASDAEEVTSQPTNVGAVTSHGRELSDIPLLPQQLRIALVATLLRLPSIQRFEERSSLLRALPSMYSLDRVSGNTKQDLEGIVDQLSHLGKTSSRQWPLILLLDAAIENVRGYTLEEDIQLLRQQLVEYYGDT
jgi:hypothetical protein